MNKKDKVITYDIDNDTVSTSLDNMLDILEKSAARLRKHVYIILEHNYQGFDERIHGVYTNREDAEKKRDRLHKVQIGGGYGYISILKFKIKGQ